MTLLDWLMPLAGLGAVGLLAATRWHRLDRAPGVPSPVSPMLGLALACAMALLASIGAQVTRSLLGLSSEAEGVPPLTPGEELVMNSKLRLGAYLMQAIIVVVYARLAWSVGAAVPRLGALRSAGIAAAALVVVYPIMNGVAILCGEAYRIITRQEAPVLAHETLRMLSEAPRDQWFVTAILLAIIAAPIFEEVLYRGLVQQSLRLATGSRWLAIMATSAIFALMHVQAVPWHALPGLFVLSMGFGWVYERTGRLAAAMLMHALFNAVNLAMALL